MGPIYVVCYEDNAGIEKKEWFTGIQAARAKHKWLKRSSKLGNIRNLYPPMEEVPPETDEAFTTKSDLVAFPNFNEEYDKGLQYSDAVSAHRLPKVLY